SEFREAHRSLRRAVGRRAELSGGGAGADPPGGARRGPCPACRRAVAGGARMTDTAAGRRRLGRGLEALLGPTREEAEGEGSLVDLPVQDIKPNPFQPRRTVDPAALEELVSSIKQAGLLQPIVVRKAPGGNGAYELIAGERRLRACQQLGWERIPAVQRDADDRTLLTLALI